MACVNPAFDANKSELEHRVNNNLKCEFDYFDSFWKCVLKEFEGESAPEIIGLEVVNDAVVNRFIFSKNS